MVDVEHARVLVRGLTPITLQFQLNSANHRPVLNTSNQFIRMLSNRYDVSITLRDSDDGSLLLMRGCTKDFDKMKEASRAIFGKSSKESTQSVSLHMHVSSNYFSLVCGPNIGFVEAVKNETGTNIICTSPGDLRVPAFKRGTLHIMGPMENVFQARQMLQGALPMVLKFDVGNEYIIKESLLHQLQVGYSIDINFKLKTRDENQIVLMKTEERNASKLYAARHQLLQLSGNPLEADIPSSYRRPIAIFDRSSLSDSHAQNLAYCRAPPSAVHPYGGEQGAYPWRDMVQRVGPVESHHQYLSDNKSQLHFRNKVV